MYSGLKFTSRLKNFQNLLSSSDPKLPEAFLFVPGIDGRNNKGSLKAIKYLFEGSFGEDLHKNGFDHDCLDDIILLIQESKISIFWSNEARNLFSPQILSSYPMVEEYLTNFEEDNEIDRFQLKKCESFKKMILSSLSTNASIGIPVPIGYDEILDIESWPILQSFALDSILYPTGFFTARYKICDITSQLEVIFKSIDIFTIDQSIETSRSIYMHSQQLLNGLNTRGGSYARTSLSVWDMLAPYDTLYEFGELGTVLPADDTLRPVLLLGRDTSMLGTCPNFHDRTNSAWKNQTIHESHLHFTVEASEPKTGLRWCRTYFLRHGSCLPIISDIQSKEDDNSQDIGAYGDFETENNLSENNSGFSSGNKMEPEIEIEPPMSGTSKLDKYLWRLQLIYLKLWMAMKLSVTTAFRRHKDILEAGNEIQTTVHAIMKGKLPVNFDASINSLKLKSHEKLQVHMDCINGIGQLASIDDIDDMGGKCYAFIRVSIHGIHISRNKESSSSDTNSSDVSQSTGSVSIGDTFIFNPGCNDPQSTPEDFLNDRLKVSLRMNLSDVHSLTSKIPYFRSFLGTGAEDYAARKLLSCLENKQMMSALELGRLFDVKGTGLIKLEMLTDCPYLPYMQSDIRPYTSGLLIEKMDSIYCSPLVISFPIHLEKVWSVNLNEFIAYSKSKFNNISNLDPFVCPEGILVIFKMKIDYTVQSNSYNSVFSKMTASNSSKLNDSKKLFQENPLSRGLPFCGFKLSDKSSPQFIAFVLKSDNSFKLLDGMHDILTEWRLSFRLNDINEIKVNSFDKNSNNFKEIPDQLVLNLLSLVDIWSFDLIPQRSSVQDIIMSGSTKTSYLEIEKLNNLQFDDIMSVSKDTHTQRHISGLGHMPLRLTFLLSELNRLNLLKQELFLESSADTLSPLKSFHSKLKSKPKMILIASHAGSGSCILTSHLKSRISANSNKRFRDIYTVSIDFNSYDGKLTNENFGFWIIDSIFSKVTSPNMENILIVTNVIPSSKNNCDYSSLLQFLDSFFDICVTLSVISPLAIYNINFNDYNESTYQISDSLNRSWDISWDTITTQIIFPEACDVICFVNGGKKQSQNEKYAEKIRSYCKSVNPDGIFVGFNNFNFWFDDDLIEDIIEGCCINEKFKSCLIRKLTNKVPSNIIPKIIFYNNESENIKLRLTSTSYEISPTASKMTIRDPEMFMSMGIDLNSDQYLPVWNITAVLLLLSELFPEASISDTVSNNLYWKIPTAESTAYRRILQLAKVKVMTLRKSKIAIDKFKFILKKIKSMTFKNSKKESIFPFLVKNIKSVHGVVFLSNANNESIQKLQLNSTPLTNTGANSNNKLPHVKSYENLNIIIEACKGSILIREADKDFSINQNQNNSSKLVAQGSFTAEEEDVLRVALKYCSEYIVKEQNYISKESIWKSEYLYLNQADPEFVDFCQQEMETCPPPMPGGWWFDGQSYLKMHENRKEYHPNIEIIVQKFCNKKNKEIKIFNDILNETRPWI